MPAPTLRHFRATPGAPGAWLAVTTAVPANRAFVISRLVVTLAPGSSQATFAFHLAAGPDTANLSTLAGNVVLNKGQSHREGGLVLQAGEQVWLFTDTPGASQVVCHVMGQEVDNA